MTLGKSRRSLLNRLCLPTMAMFLVLSISSKTSAQKEGGDGSENLSIVFHSNATAKDVGLPGYPGARPLDESGESPIDFGVSSNSSGFRLTVANLISTDSPQKITGFYKKALRKYGRVLDCGNIPPEAKTDQDGWTTKLRCQNDKPSPGKVTLKSGTLEKQHVVGIEGRSDGTIIHLVYVECSGSCRDDK